MKKANLFLILIFLVTHIQAATISFSGNTIFESDGTTPLDVGSYVSIGYFDDGFDFSNIPSSTWADLSLSYTELIGTLSGINPAGSVGLGGTQTGILNESLYVWFFDSSSVPVSIMDQEYGLFSSTSVEWIGKGDGTFDFNTMLLSDIDIAEYGSIIAGGVSLQAVPEPSTYALVAGILSISYIIVRRSRSRA